MDYQLVVVKGGSQSTAVKLADGITTVGRQDDCELRIKSSQVSRRHCQLFEKKGLLLVKDLGSSNGIFVNAKRIADQQVLQPGDELTIGQITFRVEKIGEPAPAPTAQPLASKVSGDTAIAEAILDDSSEDEFEIDFDEEPAKPVVQAVTRPPVEMPPPRPISAAPAAAPKPLAPALEPEPVADGTPAMADDAIADFLLNIKLEDD